MMEKLKVDVIIPTYKPGEKFYNLIQTLKRQSYPVDRIIVVNTEKKWFPSYFSEGNQDIELYHIKKEEFDHGGTRDRAASLCDGDILLFMTQDAVPNDNYLVEELLKPFRRPEVAAAYARQLPNENCSFVEKYTRSFNYPDRSAVKTKDDLPVYGIKTFFCSNVCAAYKRDIYQKLGGFVRKAIFNEDMIYAGRLIQEGYAVAYAADAKVIHSHNYSCMQQFHRNFDLGVSQAEHPEIFAGVPSEGEGIKLVKKTINYLIQKRKIWLIPGVILQSGCKYAGYLSGKNYRKLPRKMILWCTMNREYWKV